MSATRTLHKKAMKSPALSAHAEKILRRLSFVSFMSAMLSEEQRQAEKAAAEEELNALALEDPELATEICNRTDYFPNNVPAGWYYIGHNVIVDAWRLSLLKTPEDKLHFIQLCKVMATLQGHGDKIT